MLCSVYIESVALRQVLALAIRLCVFIMKAGNNPGLFCLLVEFRAHVYIHFLQTYVTQRASGARLHTPSHGRRSRCGGRTSWPREVDDLES